MSTWLELTNDLKRRYNNSYLSPRQKTAYNALIDHLRRPNWVNLHGPHGSGKTFLAWQVTRTIGMYYVARPDDIGHLPPMQDGLIIDNAPTTESGARAVLSECGLLNCLAVLLVTQRPIVMPMRRVELPLPTTDDIQMVAHTLARLGYICDRSSLPEQPSYWDVLATCI